METRLDVMDPCANCSGNVPEQARFCPHCGAAQVHESGPQTAAVELAPEWSWCEVEWVRSFRGSEFEARPLAPGADALARSSKFRWRGNEPPPETDADAREAHEELVHTLVAAGWEPVGDGDPWYAERLRRPLERDTAEVSIERSATPWPVRLGIILVTLGSLAAIIFTLLVLLGFFVRD